MAIKIVACNCKHKDQDKIHRGKRVANEILTPANQPAKYRCTVCGKIHA